MRHFLALSVGSVLGYIAFSALLAVAGSTVTAVAFTCYVAWLFAFKR